MNTQDKGIPSQLKARIALSALTGEKAVADLAGEFDVTQDQIQSWVSELRDKAVTLFERESKPPADSEAAVPARSARKFVEIRPQRGLANLDLGSVWKFRELLYFLVWRDLKVRYKQAAIGAGWAVAQPIFSVLVFTVVFGYFAKIPSDGVPYPVFAFAAMLPWTYFADALRRASTGLVSDSELIRKIYFPRLIIPVAAVLTPLADFAVALLVLIGLAIWYGVVPTWHVLLLPVFLFQSLLLALSFGLWLGPINVRFRDVMHTLPLLVQIWMYASPVVYPLSIVPEKWRLIYSLNPMVGVIEGFRWGLFGSERPDFMAMGISASLVVLLFLVGIVYFRKMERSFADVI
jgi:lipopolysaccharide transport system permease protein